MSGSVFDLDTTTLADAGMWCRLTHPGSGAPLSAGGGPVRVRLLGCDGERFRALQQALAARRGDRLLRDGGRPDPAADAALELELAVGATLGWDNVVLPDGTPLPFTFDDARRLYRERPWILEQVGRFIADRRNFLKASGTG